MEKVSLALPMFDAFAILNLEPAFELDELQLHQRYKEAILRAHPDLYLSAPVWLQEHVAQESEHFNRAYALLKNPLERARLILWKHDPTFEKYRLSPAHLSRLFDLHSKMEELPPLECAKCLPPLEQEFQNELVTLGLHLKTGQWVNAAQIYHFLRALNQLIKSFGKMP